MGVFSIILVIIWASIIFEGFFGLTKGYFYGEKKKEELHEPNAYRKWVKLSSVFCILCGVINMILSILDGLADGGWKYVIFICITVVIMIIAVAIAYARIVKPADKAMGIESEFDKILKENNKQ